MAGKPHVKPPGVYVGERNGFARLNESQVLEIRRRYMFNVRGQGYIALARRYRVSPSEIRRVVRRDTWKHL